MSAETLREAARLMRERAQYAPGGVWSADDWGDVVSGMEQPPEGDLSSYFFETSICRVDDSERDEEGAERLGRYIASWHPAVALAVAEWLDSLAEGWELQAEKFRPDGSHGFMGTWTTPEHHPGLAVARAYLGESA